MPKKVNFVIIGGKRINIKKIESYFCDWDNLRIFICLFDEKMPYIINFKTNEERNNAIDKLDKLVGVMAIKEE